MEYLECNSKDVFQCKLYWPVVVMTDVHTYVHSAAGAQNLVSEMSFDCFSGLSMLGLQCFLLL